MYMIWVRQTGSTYMVTTQVHSHHHQDIIYSRSRSLFRKFHLNHLLGPSSRFSSVFSCPHCYNPSLTLLPQTHSSSMYKFFHTQVARLMSPRLQYGPSGLPFQLLFAFPHRQLPESQYTACCGMHLTNSTSKCDERILHA